MVSNFVYLMYFHMDKFQSKFNYSPDDFFE